MILPTLGVQVGMISSAAFRVSDSRAAALKGGCIV